MHAGKALIDPQLIFEKIKLQAGMRVADLGCGRTGHFVFPASKVVGETGTVYAVDIVKDILENIKKRVRSQGYLNIQTVWSDIELDGRTSIPKNSLDVCFLTNVLFLTSDRTKVLKEATRLLKRKGALVITEWAKRLGPLGPSDELMVPAAYIIDSATDLGVNFVEQFEPGDYHYTVVLKKV
jgi:ubiquinone/menaquinone biosynthesis C-methylase UbiE